MIKVERIKIPYFFSEEEKSIIKANYSQAKDWSKSQFRDLKYSLRTYLRFIQGNQCCYCKRYLPWDMKSVDIEHIVNKDDHWTFGFEPKNLALSCPACNSCKTSQETLSIPNVANYPSYAGAFLIVHPYFDNYSENIAIQFPIYSAITDKGTKTIKMCKLDRLVEVERRQKEYNTRIVKIAELLELDIPECDKESTFHAIRSLMDGI